jgi:hypothetical protein
VGSISDGDVTVDADDSSVGVGAGDDDSTALTGELLDTSSA